MTEEKKEEEKKEKEPPKERYAPCLANKRQIFESVEFQGHPSFLVYDIEKKVFFCLRFFPGEKGLIMPLDKEMFPYRPYTLTMELLDRIQNWNPSRQQIFNIVYKDFDTFLDLEQEFKVLEAAETLETYEQQKLSAVSYLFHKGDNDSGKTRACDVHNYLDYRPLFSSSMPPADIFNFLGYHEEGTGTIIEDEADNLNRDKDAEKLKIYRSGYKKGATCPRIIEPSKKARTQRYYKAFCSKIFAGLYLPYDRGLMQRCVEIPMVTGYPLKDEIIEEDKERMDKIKLGLLVWRMKNYWIPLPNINIELSGRTKELWKGKIQIVSGLEQEKYLKELALSQAREKLLERSQSLEAYITRALFHLSADVGMELPFEVIWVTLLDELGVLKDDRGGDSIECQALGYKITKKAVGNRLGSVFDGKPYLRHKVGRVWKFNKEKLQRLSKKFAINDINLLNDEDEIEKTEIG